MDVDIVVQMKSWNDYNKFRESLLTAGFISDEPEHPEKLSDPATKVEVDILPFGEIAEDGKTVIWPQDNSRWSVVGIQDAYDHALKLEITNEGEAHILRFVSAPALVLLKIVAVHDRPEKRYKKDTVDIGLVIKEYLGIGNKTRLMNPPHDDILRYMGSDLDRATACLVGRDISVMASEMTRDYLVNLLAEEVASQRRCFFARGLRDSLCRGDFTRSRIVIRDILEGLKWSPNKGI